MIPYTQLRMGGSNALGIAPIPDASTDYINEFTTRILPIIHAEQDRANNMNITMANRMRAQALQDQVNAKNNPNVVLGQPPISPFQQAQLGLKQEAITGQNTRAEQSNQTKENIAGSAEQGRNTRAGAALAEKTQFGQTENDIRQQNTNIAKYKAEHPNAQVVAVPGGNYHFYDANSKTFVDTGVDSGKATDEQKSALGLSNALSEIQARGGQARQTQSEGIAQRGTQQRLTNAAKPKTTKPQSNADKATGYFNTAQQLANDPTMRDEKGNPYVTANSAHKTFTIDPNTPSDVFHTINEKIYNPGGSADHQDVNLPSDHPDPLNILRQDQSTDNQPQDQGQ